MFTGIVETVGRIHLVEEDEDGCRLSIADLDLGDDLTPGQSISVDGVCLTVERVRSDGFQVFVSTETLERSTLGRRRPDDAVNIELALPVDGRFDGHIVQGHVDTTTRLTDIEQVGEDWWVTFELPAERTDYIVEKGSIALDGISLTVAERTSTEFSVTIIPATAERTTLLDRRPGEPVNVELDIVAKYVDSLVHSESE